MGIKATAATKDKLSKIRKGKKCLWKDKISQSHIGNKNPMYGKYQENSGHWKGGKTKLSLSIRSLFQYNLWRKKVFERDNYTCQNCEKTKCYLEAHHKKEFCLILGKYKVKTIEDAIKCKQLWDINNGLTLCKNCHNKTKKYVRKNE